jgi:hypothetical protein
MKATDITLERIYKKVISNDCYDHSYYKLEEQELEPDSLVIFLTDNHTPTSVPSYLSGTDTIVWKMSNIMNITDTKWELLEKLIRKMIKKH